MKQNIKFIYLFSFVSTDFLQHSSLNILKLNILKNHSIINSSMYPLSVPADLNHTTNTTCHVKN